MDDKRTLYAQQQDRIAALEAELAVFKAAHDYRCRELADVCGKVLALEAELAERTRERDEAVGWIRVVGEECSSGGDRNTTLAKLRTDQRELAAERKRREAAEALLRSGYTTAELIAHFARYKD